MNARLACLLLAGSIGLGGCVGAAVVGGATAGIVVTSDRRSLEQQNKDSELERIIERRLKENFGDRIHVSVNAYDHAVLLTGEIPSAELKAEFDALIKLTPKIRRVIDEIRIAKPTETSWRLNDSVITANVKTRLSQSGKFDFSITKVVTEAGSVYLMGRVTQTEADATIEIARYGKGVARVVNVMEIVSDEEIARLKAGNAAASTGSAAPARSTN